MAYTSQNHSGVPKWPPFNHLTHRVYIPPKDTCPTVPRESILAPLSPVLVVPLPILSEGLTSAIDDLAGLLYNYHRHLHFCLGVKIQSSLHSPALVCLLPGPTTSFYYYYPHQLATSRWTSRAWTSRTSRDLTSTWSIVMARTTTSTARLWVVNQDAAITDRHTQHQPMVPILQHLPGRLLLVQTR